MSDFEYCNDSRPCCFRQNGKCLILYDTYRWDGECNFAKKEIMSQYSYNHLKRKRYAKQIDQGYGMD